MESQAESTHKTESAHPTPRTYIKVATVLVVVTLIEVGIFYVEPLRPVFVPIFLLLSAAKFALVAMFYMHLKFEERLLSAFFITGLVVAILVVIALMVLSRVF